MILALLGFRPALTARIDKFKDKVQNPSEQKLRQSKRLPRFYKLQLPTTLG
jgi:hypothetical protein